MPHTILLIQPGSVHTRTYVDYNSQDDCLNGILRIYEDHLKRLNPEAPVLGYNLLDLFEFLDELKDMGCLIYQNSSKGYAPYNKHWIKEKLFLLLWDMALDVEPDKERESVLLDSLKN